MSEKKTLSRKKPKVQNPVNSPSVEYDEIRERAYYIWENKGRPDNSSIENWLIAEQEANAERLNCTPKNTGKNSGKKAKK